MSAVAPGEACRLSRRRRLARRSLAWLLPMLAGCVAPDLHARAARDDAAHGTSVFTWTYDHDPARLVVWGMPESAVAAYLRNGRARGVPGDVRSACAAARHDRALLLVVAPPRGAERTDALDCGVAVDRDRFAVVIAPR